ncbi:MAG: type II toxin-antitoxin system HicA family toxin [Candidatus Omnitrophota bacterium]
MTCAPKEITARRFVKSLVEEGFVLIRIRGSHRRYRHPSGHCVTVSYHNPGELFPIGTLKGMIYDAGWKEEDLERLGLL